MLLALLLYPQRSRPQFFSQTHSKIQLQSMTVIVPCTHGYEMFEVVISAFSSSSQTHWHTHLLRVCQFVCFVFQEMQYSAFAPYFTIFYGAQILLVIILGKKLPKSRVVFVVAGRMVPEEYFVCLICFACICISQIFRLKIQSLICNFL